MSHTIRDQALAHIPDEVQRLAMEQAGFIDPDAPADGLDRLIKAVYERAWAEAEEAVGEHAEAWYLAHMRQSSDYAPPEYAQGVHAGLGLAQKVLDGEL